MLLCALLLLVLQSGEASCILNSIDAGLVWRNTSGKQRGSVEAVVEQRLSGIKYLQPSQSEAPCNILLNAIRGCGSSWRRP